MHAVSIEAGGIVPLPQVGGALSHAVGSIRNLPRTVKAEFARPAVSEREAEGARKRRQGPSIRWAGSELPDELNEYRLIPVVGSGKIDR